ncbi:MAG: hypothetical protein ACKV2T_04085 [Kofleriaceae bacterium]
MTEPSERPERPIERTVWIERRAIIVLGMHRSGTSCVARMLAAGGLASAGDAVRNWDNARGHYEMLDAVRLNEAVLAYSGGHWLSPPAEVRWSVEHAAARDRLLGAHIEDSLPALIKDPRTLLVLPFWRASAIPFHTIAIVRHPRAVARSLESWRAMSVDEGIALWLAHNRALLADRAQHTYALIDFDAPCDAMISQALAAAREFAPRFDETAFAAAYEEQLVHHDGVPDAPDDRLHEALALHARLVGPDASRVHLRGAMRTYPRAAMRAFVDHLAARDMTTAIASAREALAGIDDASAVLVPVVTSLVRHRGFDAARALIDEHAARLDDGVADLLRAKALLGANDAAGAVVHLERAIAVPHPFHQARHLLPEALRRAGRHVEARAALERIVDDTLYPHGPLSTLAEWSWLDGDHARAIDDMTRAIAAAPSNRRGRLRTRLAEWLIVRGDVTVARHELEQAIADDPAYTRSRDVLARITGT